MLLRCLKRACEFDTDGNKLFSPTIPAASRRISERSSSTVGVDDFLYRAAVVSSRRV